MAYVPFYVPTFNFNIKYLYKLINCLLKMKETRIFSSILRRVYDNFLFTNDILI